MRDRRYNGLLLGEDWMHRQHVILWCASCEVRFEIEILASCLSRDSRRKRPEELAKVHAFVIGSLRSISEPRQTAMTAVSYSPTPSIVTMAT